MSSQSSHTIENGINIEEGLAALAKQILMLRCRYQEALARKEEALEEAVQRADFLRAEERAVWEEHENYVSEVLAHQEKLTGIPDFSCRFGTFTLQDTQPTVAVSDMNELQGWMGDFLANLMLLHCALPEDRRVEKDFQGMTSPMLTDF